MKKNCDEKLGIEPRDFVAYVGKQYDFFRLYLKVVNVFFLYMVLSPISLFATT